MDLQFSPSRQDFSRPPVVAPKAAGLRANSGQQGPSVAVAAPKPHLGITLTGAPPSAGMRLDWTQPTLRPLAGGDQSLLYFAASTGNIALIKRLLGNDPGPVHKYHALCHAVAAGQPAAACVLLEHGANVNERDAETGCTALHHAVSNADADMIDLLLQGAEVNLADHAGNTPLHAAAIMNQLPVVSRLLMPSPPPCIANTDGNTPLMLAASRGHEKIVSRLAGKSDVHHVNNDGDSALTLAAAAGHAVIVQRLLGKGANAGQFNRRGASAIQLAAEGGHLEVLLSLLASPGHVIDQAGTTRQEALQLVATLAAQRDGAGDQTDQRQRDQALLAACTSGKVVKVALLLACGAALESRDEQHGYTALMKAAARGHTAVCGLLMAKGASVNATDVHGNSVLMRAAGGTSLALVEILLAKGANPSHQAKSRHSALDCAVEDGGYLPIIALLSQGVDLNMERPVGDYLLCMAAAHAAKCGHTASIGIFR